MCWTSFPPERRAAAAPPLPVLPLLLRSTFYCLPNGCFSLASSSVVLKLVPGKNSLLVLLSSAAGTATAARARSFSLQQLLGRRHRSVVVQHLHNCIVMRAHTHTRKKINSNGNTQLISISPSSFTCAREEKCQN